MSGTVADVAGEAAGLLTGLRDGRRLAALRGTGLLDDPPRAAFDRLTRLAAAILHAPVALVSLVDADRQVFASCVGLPEPWASRRETPLSHSFCQHAVEAGKALIVEDARQHPLVRDNCAIPDLGVVAYAGIPLVTTTGAVLGSFCVIDHVPREWTPDELAILTDLAASAVTEIELHTAVRERERQADHLGRLYALSSALSSALTPTQVADAILAEGCHALGAEAGLVALLTPDGAFLDIVAAQGYDPAVPEPYRHIPLDTPLPVAEVVRSGEALFLTSVADRAAHHPAGIPIPRRDPDEAIVAVPLAIDGHPLGAVRWSFAPCRTFDPEERAFLLALAQQCAHALQRARLYDGERAARERLAEHDRLRSKFIATVSHELQTPLATVRAGLGLLEAGMGAQLPPGEAAVLAAARRSVERLRLRIDDLLVANRLDAGALRPARAPLDLRDTIADALATLHPLLREKSQKVVVELPEPLPVMADPHLLGQIVVNLIANANRHTPAGTRIVVDGRVADSHVYLSVADTGPGIPAAELDAIFGRFYRAHSAAPRGTGLGLSIARDLATLHGGRLWAANRPGGGAVFHLALPVDAHDKEDE